MQPGRQNTIEKTQTPKQKETPLQDDLPPIPGAEGGNPPPLSLPRHGDTMPAWAGMSYEMDIRRDDAPQKAPATASIARAGLSVVSASREYPLCSADTKKNRKTDKKKFL
jgi:hypothetical protein